MKTNTISPDDGTDRDGLSPTTLFRAFAAPRRQHALQYLLCEPGAVPLGSVAEYVAIAEGEPTRDRYERILVSLCHHHVPHLVDAGLVEYDPEGETLELTVPSRAVRPYARLASDSQSA